VGLGSAAFGSRSRLKRKKKGKEKEGAVEKEGAGFVLGKIAAVAKPGRPDGL